MNITKPYKLNSSTWSDEELDAIVGTIKSDRTSMGDAVFKFEHEFAKFVGSKYAVMVNSGSSANLLMIASLRYSNNYYNLLPNDEVIVPAVSWPTTYYPLYQYGLKLKFVDIDLNTLNYDLSKLNDALTDKTKAIVAVNLLGNPNDFNEISNIINDENILLLEDNCESLGSEFENKYAGTFGIMGTYSFFFSHHMSTMEGGMVVTDDEHLHDILLSLRAHGWTRNLDKYNTLCQKSDNLFDESFRFILPGYNVRPLEIEGAIGSTQLKKLPKFLEQRRENAKYFKQVFENNKFVQIQEEIGESSWFGFSLIVKDDAPFTRDDLAKVFLNNHIECRKIVAGNFARKEVVKYFNYEIFGDLKNADIVDNNGIYIGNDHLDHKDDIDNVKHIIDNLSK